MDWGALDDFDPDADDFLLSKIAALAAAEPGHVVAPADPAGQPVQPVDAAAEWGRVVAPAEPVDQLAPPVVASTGSRALRVDACELGVANAADLNHVFRNLDEPDAIALRDGITLLCDGARIVKPRRFYLLGERFRAKPKHAVKCFFVDDAQGVRVAAELTPVSKDKRKGGKIRKGAYILCCDPQPAGDNRWRYAVEVRRFADEMPNCDRCGKRASHGRFCARHTPARARGAESGDENAATGSDSKRARSDGGLSGDRDCDIAYVFRKRNALETIQPGHVVALVEQAGGICATREPDAADCVRMWLVCANDSRAHRAHYETAWQRPAVVRDPYALRTDDSAVPLVVFGIAMVRSDEVRQSMPGQLQHKRSATTFSEADALRAPCRADANVMGVPVLISGDAFAVINAMTIEDAIAIVRAHSQKARVVRPVFGQAAVEFAPRQVRVNGWTLDDDDDDTGDDGVEGDEYNSYGDPTQLLQAFQQLRVGSNNDDDDDLPEEVVPAGELMDVTVLVQLLRAGHSVVLEGAAGLGKSTVCRELVRHGNAPRHNHTDVSDDDDGDGDNAGDNSDHDDDDNVSGDQSSLSSASSDTDGSADDSKGKGELSASTGGDDDSAEDSVDDWVFMPVVRLRDVHMLEPHELLKVTFGDVQARLLWDVLAKHERVVWTFDGFEELGADSAVAEQLRNVAWARIKLVTTRPTGCVVLGEAVRAELAPLSRDGMRELVEQSVDATHAGTLLVRLQSDARLAQLMESPLLCAVVCHLHASGAAFGSAIDASHASIIEWAASYVTESALRHCVDVRADHASTALDKRLAGETMDKLCTAALRQLEQPDRYAAMLVSDEVLQECGLLVMVPRTLGRYEFVHASFLEYFACRAVVAHKQRDVVAFALAHLENASVLEMLRHFVSDEEAPRFLAAVQSACVERGRLKSTSVMSALLAGPAPVYCASLCAAVSGPRDADDAVAFVKAQLLPLYHGSVRLIAMTAARRGQSQLCALLMGAAPLPLAEMVRLIRKLVVTGRGDILVALRPLLLPHAEAIGYSLIVNGNWDKYFDKSTGKFLAGSMGWWAKRGHLLCG